MGFCKKFFTEIASAVRELKVKSVFFREIVGIGSLIFKVIFPLNLMLFVPLVKVLFHKNSAESLFAGIVQVVPHVKGVFS